MTLSSRIAAALLALAVLAPGRAPAEQTVGLFLNDSTRAFRGYTLFAPLRYTTTYLIDNNGQLVHSWPGTVTPGHSCYLLEDGHLLRAATTGNPVFNMGGAGGRVQEFDWDGPVLWDFTYSTSQVLQHHDVARLPNGNTLMIAWELKSRTQSIAAGRNPAYVAGAGLWPDHLIEVHPTGPSTGAIVWEWHVWDHMIQDYDPTKPNYGAVADHPELIDLNFVHSAPDWNHTNSVEYDAALDQIVLSIHNFNEIWVIDHSTTTAEAAGHAGGIYGHGGDLLYRWGNPRAYRRGVAGDQKLFGQHNAQWIADGLPGAGRFLVFNNGMTRGYSSVDEFVSPADPSGNYPPLAPGEAYGPAGLAWTYVASPPQSFYAVNISGANRLANGNTLVCDGPRGVFFEVTAAGDSVWLYVNPVVASGPLMQGDPIPGGPGGQENSVFRATRYAPDYAGLAGRDLTPQGTIEIPPPAAVEPAAPTPTFRLERPVPDPFTARATARFALAAAGQVRVDLLDVQGRIVRRLAGGMFAAGAHDVAIEGGELPAGLYFVRLVTREQVEVRKIARVR